LALGYRSVEEMLQTLSHAEYVDWLAYYSIEPFPEEREDLRHARLIAGIAEMVGGKKQNIKDFMFDFWGDPQNTKEQSPEEVVSKLKTIFSAFAKRKESNDDSTGTPSTT
jgi:hypothetical protein